MRVVSTVLCDDRCVVNEGSEYSAVCSDAFEKPQIVALERSQSTDLVIFIVSSSFVCRGSNVPQPATEGD